MIRIKHLRLKLYVLVFALGVAFGASLLFTVAHRVEPLSEIATDTREPMWMAIWDWAFKDSISAYTLMLMVFTGGLWTSTHRLWRAGLDQAKLTQELFTAETRPLVGFEGTIRGKAVAGAAPNNTIVILGNTLVSNSGKYPASNVRLQFHHHTQVGPTSISEVVSNESKRQNKTLSGQVVFPGKNARIHTGFPFPYPIGEDGEASALCSVTIFYGYGNTSRALYHTSQYVRITLSGPDAITGRYDVEFIPIAIGESAT